MRTTSSLISGGLLACLAAAKPMPQQLDFAQIAAAPSVASGPEDNGVANQVASLLTSVALTGPVSLATASPAKRVEPVQKRDMSGIISTFAAAFGASGSSSGVSSGGLAWLTGGSSHNVQGNVNNFGSLVFSQTDYLKSNPKAGGMGCGWNGHDSNNGNLQNQFGASIQVNDFGAWGSADFEWSLRSFINNGSLQWCAQGDFGGSIFKWAADIDSYNYGFISFEQAKANGVASSGTSWRTSSLSSGSGKCSNLYNHGTFRLINVLHRNVHNIYGSGCWQIGFGATFYLEAGTGIYNNPTGGPSLPGQSITFADASAVLHMEAGVYSQNSNFGAKVFGYGQGNCLSFTELISRYSYNAQTGFLTVFMWSGKSVSINIGLGYDAGKFTKGWTTISGSWMPVNGIYYGGSCPGQSPPPTCTSSLPPCGNLGSNPPSPKPTTSSVCTAKSKTTSAAAVTSTSTSSAPVIVTPTSTSVAPITTPTAPTSTSTSVVTSVATITTSFVTSTPVTTSTTSPYSPCYPALSTCVPGGGTPTTSSTTACPTTPEDGTYCGFINPEDPCAPQPDGYGPVPTPDTDTAFLAYAPFHSMASAAPTVVPSAEGTQYTQTFVDLNAASSAQSYLGLNTLETYDVAGCAALCDKTSMCTAFNIFIERDPSLNPTKNDSTAPTVWGYYCPNPKSMTSYKCTLWGSNLDASTATNQGEWREDFHVVITGSNGYDKTNVTTPTDPTSPVTITVPTATSTAVPSSSSTAAASPTTVTSAVGGSGSTSSPATPTASSQPAGGQKTSTSTCTTGAAPTGKPGKPWGKPHNCGGKGIDAPKWWIGSQFFPGPFNVQVCSDFALKQNALNKASAIAAGKSSYTPCQMFNAYYLHKNGVPHGTYCSLYTANLDDSFATYTGGVFNGDKYQCKNSWTYTLTIPDSGKC